MRTALWLRGRAVLGVLGLGVAACLALAQTAGDAPTPPKLRLPGTAQPVQYTAELTLVPSEDTFRGVLDVEVRLKEKTSILWLNGTALTIESASASLAGQSVGARAVAGGEDFVGFALDPAVGPGDLKLHVAYRGEIRKNSTAGVFKQKDGDAWYIYTQFEATDARRAFPCFDEPSYKVPWQIVLRIPKDVFAVSNTLVISEKETSDGLKAIRFQRTPPLPSYLVAFGVGPFDFVDAGKAGAKKTPLRIVVPKGKAARARYAAETTRPLLERLEQYFGVPYPYEKLDQLVIPQTVGFGAMENPGLITWNESILIAPPAEETVAFRRRQTSVNAHELAHQWFGDLVTLAWWDDVWLNESFADWIAQKMVMAWKPEWEGDVFRVVSASGAMSRDALVTARKVRQEILSKDDIQNAFDTISYNKGAATLWMFESWVGEKKFQTGVRRYLEAHRFGNATADDFLKALEEASFPGVARAFSTFLDQGGVPLLDVSLACSPGAAPQLTLSQKRFLPVGSKGSAAETWRIPVCYRYGAGDKGERACALLAKESETMSLKSSTCPAWFVAKDAGLGYYRAVYRGDLFTRILDAAPHLSIAEQVALVRDTGALAEGGALPIGDALALVPRFGGSPSRQLVAATVSIAGGLRAGLVPPDLRGNYARFLSRTYAERARELGFLPKPGEDEDTRLLRQSLVGFVASEGEDSVLRAEAKRLAEQWLSDRASISPDLAGQILGVAAEGGDRALFERYLEAAKKSPERRDRVRFLAALDAFREPTLVKDALSLFLSDAFDPREAIAVVQSAAGQQANRSMVWEWLEAHYDEIVKRLPPEVTGFLPFFGAGFCDEEHRQNVELFFRERVTKLPGGPRALAQTLETISLCAARRSAQEPGVRTFLGKY